MLTVECIAISMEKIGLKAGTTAYFCGGGCKNNALFHNLKRRLDPVAVFTTDRLGFDPDFVEAATFAWFARQRLSGIPIQLLTGPNQSPILLGSLVFPPGVSVHEPRCVEL
jgi:1,6-anhydro-N-acetylmuramate kinase